MPWRVLAIVSLGVNLLLAVAWLGMQRRSSDSAGGSQAATDLPGTATAKTNVVLRRQFFSWQEVEAADYPTYIANLRAIGCPEQTVRDIIIADVNALYARRRATDPEIVTPSQQWWRSEPDTNLVRAAAAKIHALDEDRRALLTRLLGASWEAGDLVNLPRPTKPGVVLDGPLLGTLPEETKQALQQVNARSEARMQAYLEGRQQQGLAPDAAELAKLRRQTRDELAQLLSPAPLEEFLLRYSQSANELRSNFGRLRYFDPSPEEFKAVFRATDNLDHQLQLLGDSSDPAAMQARQALETQRENAIRLALGSRRYEDYVALQDPLFRYAVATALEAGTPEAARTIYQINLAAAATLDAISNNPALTSEQKAIEQKQLEVDQLKATALAAGQELPPEPPPLPSTPVRRSYTLRQGDTPAVISLIHGVPESAIRAANPNLDFNRLRPGDSVTIPQGALQPAGAPRLTPSSP